MNMTWLRRLCTWCTLCTLCTWCTPVSAQTFSRDIAPIVFDACVSCHRDGGPGPFPLTTYDEVRRRAAQIARVTASRFMPPWKVEPGISHLKGGAPEGDSKATPPVPKHADGWLLGKPDLIVKPEAAYTLPPLETDAFRIFAIRIPVTKRAYVTGINPS
jgi:hypothetical protein